MYFYLQLLSMPMIPAGLVLKCKYKNILKQPILKKPTA